MLEEQASERDLMLMDGFAGGAHRSCSWRSRGAALLASPDQIIAVAHNTIQETAISPTMPKWCYCMEWGESFQKWTNGPGVRSLSTSL
jgi:hypothetical protein